MTRSIAACSFIAIVFGVFSATGCVPTTATKQDNSKSNSNVSARQIEPPSGKPNRIQEVSEPKAGSQIEEDSGENLAHEDPGLCPDLANAVEVDREDQVVVDPAVKELPAEPKAEEPKEANQPKTPDVKEKEAFPILVRTAALRGRSGATREKMLRAYGGNDETEQAVAAGLAWLAKKQLDDGSWRFDAKGNNSKDPKIAAEELKVANDRIAATGMALLPFLANGETHVFAKKYKKIVRDGLEYLADHLEEDGHFKGRGNYSQAIATIPLCEVAGMTSDPKYLEAAQRACDYIVKNQAENGSWGYSGKSDGDTSILGWQIRRSKPVNSRDRKSRTKLSKMQRSF